MKEYKTIIIGGGISGLACARTLFDNKNNDFKLITKDLGGRMLTSKSHTVDYGASYITTEYKNVLKYVVKGDPLRLKDLYYIQDEIVANIYSLRNIFKIFKILKMAYLINDFTKRLSRFRKRSLLIGQKKALLKDKVLTKYTKMSVCEFVKKKKIEKLHENFFHPILQSTVFVDETKSNVFNYLAVLIPMVRRTYTADFKKTISKLTKDIKKNIVKGEVISLKKNKDNKYVVKTKKSRYITKNVVIATPYTQAHKFYPVKKSGPVIPIYVVHIVGKRVEVYQNKKVIFFKPKHHEITILWRQYTGSDIIFSKVKNPNLDIYYDNHRIIEKKYWRNSMMLAGNVNKWVTQKLDKNLFLASDYNICGLEDSYLTGVYAANKILKK